MGFWDQVWATVLGAAIFGVLGGATTWVVANARQHLGRRPDWEVSLELNNDLVLKRSGRRTAFDVEARLVGDNGALIADLPGHSVYPDMPKGESRSFGHHAGAKYVVIFWIDGERLMAEAPIPTTSDTPRRVTAKRARRRLRIGWA
jgi:hypothetical protein